MCFHMVFHICVSHGNLMVCNMVVLAFSLAFSHVCSHAAFAAAHCQVSLTSLVLLVRLRRLDGEGGEIQGDCCGKAQVCISQNRQLVEDAQCYHSFGCGRHLAGEKPCQEIVKEELV